MQHIRILIADDEKAARVGLSRALRRCDATLLEADDGSQALQAIREQQPDLVFLDLTMPHMDGLSVLRELSAEAVEPQCEIIVVTASDSIETAIECVRLGAADYLTKPYEVERVRCIAARVAERVSLRNRVAQLRRQLDAHTEFGAMVGGSRVMEKLFEQTLRAARVALPVLIRGETGTGKELVARELHRLSDRSQGPFVAVNTAAIPESLIESELFGHVKGAFTGADADRTGVFREADGGTLFLDEIGDMPLPAQARILRVLQEQVVQPVGTSQSIPVNVRIVSATHQDLEEAIEAGHFRQDLLYRLRGIELQLPPLRRRREDIMALASHFLRQFPEAPELAPCAVDALLTHDWPGNVRELQQAVTSAAAMASGGRIVAADLGIRSRGTDLTREFGDLLDLPLTEARTRLVSEFERAAITLALQTHGGNVSAAARQLGIHRQSLQQKIEKLGLQ